MVSVKCVDVGVTWKKSQNRFNLLRHKISPKNDIAKLRKSQDKVLTMSPYQNV